MNLEAITNEIWGRIEYLGEELACGGLDGPAFDEATAERDKLEDMASMTTT